MHKKRIKNKDYYYTTIRENSGKTKTIYLGSNLKTAKHKERELGLTHKKNPHFFHIFFIIFTIFSLSLIGFSLTGFVTQEIGKSSEKINTLDTEKLEIEKENKVEEEKPSIEPTEEPSIEPTLQPTSRSEVKPTLTPSNQTPETNLTPTLTKNITILHYDVIINQPAKWEKTVNLEKETNQLEVKIPKEAFNITINKITNKERNLITGNFFLNLFKTTGYTIYEKSETHEQTIKIEGPLKGAKVEYYLPGPTTKEKQITDSKKQIIVSSKHPYENVLTYTKINNTPLESINLYHLNKEKKSREKTEFIGHDKDQDGLIDYIERITPHLSDETYDLEINILNVQSYPELGGNWTVMFNTTGTADLIITGINGTYFNEDLEFLTIKCGSEELNYETQENSIMVENYECNNETGFEISKVLTPGRHHLEFNFGGLLGYAHNLATISTCQTLNINNEYYVLDSDIDDDDGTCFTVAASNITLDCENHYIDGDNDTSGYGVIINNAAYDGLTIRNCTIKQFARNLYVGANSDNITIQNSNLIEGYYDGMLTYSVDNMHLVNSNFSGQIEYGAYLWHSGGAYNTNWSIRNCTFTGGGTATDYGIQMAYISGLEIVNSTFNGGNGATYGYGASIQYVNNTHIENSSFIGGSADRDRGIYMMYGNNISFVNNIATDSINDYPAGEFYAIDDSNITNNSFTAPNTYGLRLNYYSENNIIENNNIISRNGVSIQTFSENNNFTNNHIVSSNAYGFYIYNYATGNRFVDNDVTSYSYAAYQDSYSSGSYYINNSMISTNSYGMYWYDHSGGNTLYNNNLTSNTNYGIRAYQTSGNNNLTGNNISSNTNTLRFEDDCDNNYVDSNNIYSTTNVGIYIATGSTNDNIFKNNVIRGGTTAFQDSTTSTNLVLINNTLTATNGYGFYSTNGNNITILNNTILSGTSNDNAFGNDVIDGGLVQNNIINGTASGFLILGGTRDVRYINNTVWGALGNGNYYGLYLYQASENNTFINNSLISFHYRGVYLDDAINNTFIGNYISAGAAVGWTADNGIYLNYADDNNFTNNTINNTGGTGIYLAYSDNTVLRDNTFSNNYVGIYCAYCFMGLNDLANTKIFNTSVSYDYRVTGSAEVLSNISFLNCTYNEDEVYIREDYSKVHQAWYATVNVSNTDGQVANATVGVYDLNSTFVVNETTDENGLTIPIPLKEYIAVRDGNDNLRKSYYSNYSFNSTEGEHFSGIALGNMTTSQMIYISLADWPLVTILSNYPLTQDYSANNILQIRANETTRNDLITATNITIIFANGTSVTYPMTNGTLGDPDLWEYNYTINIADVGGPFNLTAAAYNDTGYNYINDTNEGYSIKPTLVWFKSYNTDDKAQSFYSENETSRLKTLIYNAYSNYPKITILDVLGNEKISQEQMASEDGSTFYLDYPVNGSVGYYNATIFANGTDIESFDYSFYQGSNWQTAYIDNESEVYVYAKEVNITEPGILERFFYPVSVWVNFTEDTNLNSIRVTYYNGSTHTEIPSQVYNYTADNVTITAAQVVWLASFSRGENRTYYIHYNDITNGNATYGTDLDTYTTTSNYQFFNNSYFTIRTDSDDGAVIDAAWTTQGTTDNLAGQDPMQTSPSLLTITLDSYSAQNDETPTRTMEYSGPILNKFVVNSYLSQSDGTQNTDLPFNQTYWVYSNNNYLIYETDMDFLSGYNVENLIDHFMSYGDGYFNKVAFRYPNGTVSENTVSTGNGADYTNLNINLTYLGIYHNESKTAAGEIFLNRTSSLESTAKVDFWDQASYEFYKRYLISSPEAVSAGSEYTTKVAKMFWDGEEGYSTLNDTYHTYHNPTNSTLGGILYGDTAYPTYSDYNVTSETPNDNESITCYSYWVDDLRLKQGYVETNATGTVVNHTITVSGNSDYINYTINSTDLRGTSIYCKFHAKDIGNNMNSTPQKAITVTDVTPPMIINISYTPEDSDSLDPGTSFNITANVTDKISLSTIFLQYTTPDNETFWNETQMQIFSGDYYITNITTSSTAGNYTFRINATDAVGNNYTSSETIVLVEQDLSWNLTPASFDAVSGLIGSTIEVFNLTINNTADYTANFTLTSTRDSWIYYNDSLEPYEIELSAHNHRTINVTAILPVDIGEYSITVTTTHDNATADPATATSIGSVVAYQSGPYLWASFTVGSTSVLLGDTDKNYTVRIKNLGNETATGINNTITLPEGFTTTDALTSETATLAPNAYYYHTVLLDVPSSSDDSTVIITSTPAANNTNQTHEATIDVELVNPVVEGEGEETSSSGGSGGGGGGSGLSEDESARFFQSTQVFEITRGKNQEFTFVLKNPYEDAILKKLNLDLEGFTEEYIRYYPNHIRELRPNTERNITVVITAPGYFTRGEYELLFTITGDVYKNASEIIPLTYTKTLLLYLRDVSREDAIEYKDLANFYLEDMQNNNFYVEEITELNKQLNSYFDQSLFKEVKESHENAKELYEAAIETSEELIKLSEEIALAKSKKVKVDETERLYSLTKTAFKRGDFLSALERIKEARLTLAIETSSHYIKEAIYIMKSNKKETATGALALFIFTTGTTIAARFRLVKRKLKKLSEEENLLINMMKAIQIEVFEKAKMSMKEYGEAMVQYEERLNKIMEDRILFENKKQNLMKFKSRARKLKEERNQLTIKMADAQKAYITQGKYETRVYENMLKSYSTRLSEVEEKIALMDVKKAKK